MDDGGGAMEAGKDWRRLAISGFNFSLHACSVYYFIFHRSVGHGKFMCPRTAGGSRTTANRTLWSCALGTSLLGCISISQFLSCLFANVKSSVAGQILLFLCLRGVLFFSAAIGFIQFPSKECWKVATLLLIEQEERHLQEQEKREEKREEMREEQRKERREEQREEMRERERERREEEEREEQHHPPEKSSLWCIFQNLMTFRFFDDTLSTSSITTTPATTPATTPTTDIWSTRADLLSRITFWIYLALSIYVTVKTTTTTSVSTVTASYDLGRHSIGFGITVSVPF